MAWGINNRVLDSAQYIDCVRKAWRDLVANVGSNGMLQRCQTVSIQPAPVGVNNSSVEGEAAFMLAGEEMWKLARGNTVSVQNKSPAIQAGRYPLKVLIVTLNRTGDILVPPDVQGVEIFNIQGKSIYRFDATHGNKIFAQNISLKNSVYVIKFTR